MRLTDEGLKDRQVWLDHGLVADGIVGKLTWESLMSQLRPIPGIDEETAA